MQQVHYNCMHSVNEQQLDELNIKQAEKQSWI